MKNDSTNLRREIHSLKPGCFHIIVKIIKYTDTEQSINLNTSILISTGTNNGTHHVT